MPRRSDVFARTRSLVSDSKLLTTKAFLKTIVAVSLLGVLCFVGLTRRGKHLAPGVNGSGVNTEQQAQVKKAYGEIPLSFEANQGQVDARVKYVARGSGYSLFLTPQEAVLSLSTASSGLPSQVSDEIQRKLGKP